MHFLKLVGLLGGLVVLAGSAQGDLSAGEEVTGILGLAGCLDSTRPGGCFRTRATQLVKRWLISYEELAEDNRGADGQPEDEKLPEGLPPFVHDLVDSLVARLSRLFGERTDEPEEEEEEAKALTGNEFKGEGDRHQVEARGKKKKIKKAIRRAIIKLIIISLLIKHKIKMLLMAFQTFLLFKFVLLAAIYVLATIFKVWAEIKHKHHPQKVIYYENAHHQHHYDHDHDHYDDHGWTGGLWGRSIVAPPESGTGAYQAQSAHFDAYSAHVPKQ